MIVGTVLRADRMQIELEIDRGGEQVGFTIPWNLVKKLEISSGEVGGLHGVRLGAKQGALVGAATGAAWVGFFRVLEALTLENENRADCTISGCSEAYRNQKFFGILPVDPTASNFAMMTIGGGVTGAAVGALLGARSRERWKALPLQNIVIGRDSGRTSLLFTVPF